MTLTLYKQELNSINNRIVNILKNNTDEETGEINELILDELEGLELKKEELITVLALSFHDLNTMIQSIDNHPVMTEAKRLKELQKYYSQSVSSLKNLLSRVVPEGEKIETDRYKISWRKSTSYQIDDLIDLEELEKQYPQLVKVERSFRASEAKNYHKETGTLPEGIIEIKRNNLQIK